MMGRLLCAAAALPDWAGAADEAADFEAVAPCGGVEMGVTGGHVIALAGEGTRRAGG